jgi:hypothetical protein
MELLLFCPLTAVVGSRAKRRVVRWQTLEWTGFSPKPDDENE